MSYLPATPLLDLMEGAYRCPHFQSCPEATYSPNQGLVPRGFIGATGKIDDIQAIFVLAEPGHPLNGETYANDPATSIKQTLDHTYQSYRDGVNQLHKNVRMVMSMIWPRLSFDEQLRHVWITESRLCSIEKEIGNLNDKLCVATHLSKQFDLLPNAVIVAFGSKAKSRICRAIDIDSRSIQFCRALAPPGCNRRDAPASWKVAAEIIRQKYNLNLQ